MTIQVITITDLRRAGFCVSGVRKWCNRDPDISLRKLIEEGIEVTDEIREKYPEVIHAVEMTRKANHGRS
jgi:hypothetical protein